VAPRDRLRVILALRSTCRTRGRWLSFSSSITDRDRATTNPALVVAKMATHHRMRFNSARTRCPQCSTATGLANTGSACSKRTAFRCWMRGLSLSPAGRSRPVPPVPKQYELRLLR
jgi:hypothetical protein